MTLTVPLKPRTFHVLLALSEGPQHGYGIKRRVKERTEGRIELEPGGLYRLIAKLEQDGIAEPCDPPSGESSADQRRRYYRLTSRGREVLADEARRLTRLAALPEVTDLARAP